MNDERPMDESLSQSVSLAYARAGHDLRQPVQALLLLTHLMEMTLNQEQRAKTARTMERALLNLQSMLDSLSATARVEAGILIKKVERVDLGAVVDKAVVAFKAMGTGCGVRILTYGMPIEVRTDGARLTQLILDLLLNIAKSAGEVELDISAARTAAEARLKLVYTGVAPVTSAKLATFVELKFGQGAAGEGGVVAGPGLLAVIAAQLGCSLTREVGDGKQTVYLTLPKLKAGT